jgi:3-hydroxyisobutyrate dehydrogenase
MAGGTVGFVGLGAMGGPMAANLVRAGFAVNGFDVAPHALEMLTAAGGNAVRSPAEAAEGAGVLVLMVATPAQVDSVLFGEGDAAGRLRDGATVILHSTVPTAFVTALDRRLAGQGLQLLDAPVSGGQAGARDGKLTIMASGSADAFAAGDPVMQAYAKTVYRLGDAPGIGSTVKTINQLLAGVHIAAAAEAMALATKAGADPATVFDVLRNAAGNSWMFENRVPHILARDFTPLSAVDIFVKDLGIVLDTGRDLRFPLPLAAAAHQQFLAAAAAGLGREDDSAVVKVYEKLAGIEVKGKKA